MKLSIIIVSFNTRKLTLQTLDSIAADLKTNPNLAKDTTIVVVDNNSSDDSVTELKKWAKAHPKLNFKLLPQKENLGFGKANNLGVSKNQSQLYFFLNSDTIVQPGCLSTLVEAFEANPLGQPTADLSSYGDKLDRLGLLAATLLNQDGSLQPQGGQQPNLWSLASHMLMLDDLPFVGQLFPSTQDTGYHTHQTIHLDNSNQPTKLHPIGWAAATALMVRAETLAEIGDFDPNIFMYGEDVELSIRAKAHHWDVAIHPGAQVVHLVAASSNPSRALIGELLGYQYIWSKHRPHWQIPLATFLLILGSQLRRLVFGTILRQPDKAAIYAEAMTHLKNRED